MLVSVASMIVVAASMAPVSGNADEAAAPWVTEKPAGYRDWKWVSSAHEAGKLNSLGAVLGNEVAIKAYRAGTLPFLDGTIVAALHYGHAPSAENDRILARRNLSFLVRPRTFSLWLRTQKSTPRREAGGSVISTQMANLWMRRS